MLVRTVLIEQNPHLRRQLAEAIRHKGLELAGAYEHVNERLFADLNEIAPHLVIFPMKHGHARQWRLVRALQALRQRPVLMALAPVDSPAIHQSALERGIDYVFDPLLEVDGFLDALHELKVREGLADEVLELIR